MKSAKKLLAVIAGLGVCLSSVAYAADTQPVEAPESPEVLESGEPLDADVNIREERHKTVYEYRRNGQLFLVKVQPKVRGAKPYYFYDQNGDGNLDFSPIDPTAVMNVNQWELYRW